MAKILNTGSGVRRFINTKVVVCKYNSMKRPALESEAGLLVAFIATLEKALPVDILTTLKKSLALSGSREGSSIS